MKQNIGYSTAGLFTVLIMVYHRHSDCLLNEHLKRPRGVMSPERSLPPPHPPPPPNFQPQTILTAKMPCCSGTSWSGTDSKEVYFCRRPEESNNHSLSVAESLYISIRIFHMISVNKKNELAGKTHLSSHIFPFRN